MEIQLWREILAPYQLAVDEMMVKFKHLQDEYRIAGTYCPINKVEGRVKRISSILEKLQKKNFTIEDVEEKIEDIAGIRIICQFVEDIDVVVNLIRKRKDMEVKTEKDYINNIKPSGYRSYHLIVLYSVETINGTKTLPVEIQVRTLAMDFWATIEHSLQYKYRYNMPDVIRERLNNAAKAVISLDNEMSSIRNEIMDVQNSYQLKSSIVGEILNTIQNLYKVANKREIIKIQDEFYNVYMQSDINALERFSKELDIIAEGYRAQAIQ